MDPITASTSFASILGLIGLFRQEKGVQTNLNHQDFIEWLENHRHETIKAIIQNTADIQREVDTLLQQGQEEILSKLVGISEVLASITNKMDGFGKLASLLGIDSEISDQAFMILKRLVESESENFHLIRMLESKFWHFQRVAQCQQLSHVI